MGKALEEYKKYLENRVSAVDTLASDNLKAKQAADEAQITAYDSADKAFSEGIKAIEEEGIKLQEAAMLENEKENQKAAKELEKKMAKELAKAKKAK
jgi:DNA polymerase I-like protein with 3'-5' exonuclease and polymerase domains